MIKVGLLGCPDDGGNAIEMIPDVKPAKVSVPNSKFLSGCPSIVGYYKNTYQVTCPFDLEWAVCHNEDGTWDWAINEENSSISLDSRLISPIDILGASPDGRVCQIHPHPMWSFVSDTKDVIVLQHSNGDTKNPDIITGMMDIYKWPDRPLSVAYSCDKADNKFNLQKGQPWYFITFITPNQETVKLVELEDRHPFLKRTRNKSNLGFFRKLNWTKIFNHFGEVRPKKLM